MWLGQPHALLIKYINHVLNHTNLMAWLHFEWLNFSINKPTTSTQRFMRAWCITPPISWYLAFLLPKGAIKETLHQNLDIYKCGTIKSFTKILIFGFSKVPLKKHYTKILIIYICKCGTSTQAPANHKVKEYIKGKE